MDDPFEVSKLKVARAKEHIQDLERGMQAFADTKPYKFIAENNPKAKDRIFHKFKFTKPLPRRLDIIVGETVNCLREALDNACYTTATIAGKVNPLHCQFPFAANLDGLENALGKSKDIPQDIIALLRRLKPYRGGNDMPWALNRICVTHKHKILIPTAMVARQTGIRVTGARVGVPLSFRPVFFGWNPSKQEIVVAETDPNLKVDCDVEALVVFGKIEIVSGKPATGVLNEFISIVEGILLAIEAETRRLFPVAF